MAQIKKFSEYFEQPQAQEKQEVKEATSKSIDISYLAGMDVEKGIDAVYAKVSKDLTKSFKGKNVSFMGIKTANMKEVRATGEIESIEVMDYDDDVNYVTVTLKNGVTYGAVSELTILD